MSQQAAPRWTRAAMSARLVRYADLVPCRTAFIDTRTPGSTEKENFSIIGAGVSESADQHVHITERHGFNIGAARQPFGCVNSQHSHETAEVFVVHSGRWRLVFGPGREDGAIEIGPGDAASIPTRMFRGFEKVDPGAGFLWVVIGEDEPGRVTWAPAVLLAAKEHGLRLLKSGRLVEGEPDSPETETETETGPGDEQVSAMITPPMEDLARCVLPAGEMNANPDSALAAPGVEEAGVIAARATRDGFGPGPITGWWRHGFNLRRLTLQSGARVPLHVRAEPEVIFIQDGTVEVGWGDDALVLGAGDTLSVPAGLPRSFRNAASVPASVFVVRGSDDPAAAVFIV